MKRLHCRVVLSWGILLAALPVISACGSNTAEPAPPAATGDPGNLTLTSDVTIIYLGHCGYAVWTGNRLLIFDYSEFYERPPADRSFALGYVNPAEMKDLDVTVLVSHNHIDHYDPVILGWQSVVAKIKYIYGWAGRSGAGHYSLSEPRATLSIEGMDVYTVFDHHDDTDEVAFLVSLDGLVVFHGGDYQGRVAPNAPMTVTEDMRYLATRAGRPDLFFIGAWIGDCNLQAIEGLNPRIIFPMHYGGQESKYIEFASALKAAGVAQPVICPAKRGDRYIYRDGQIVGR